MKTLKSKLLSIFILLAAISSVGVGISIYFQFIGYINESMKSDMENAAIFVENTIPYNSFSDFIKALENSEEQALQYKDFMGQYAVDNDFAFLYLVTSSGSSIPTVEVSNYLKDEVLIMWESPAPEALTALKENVNLYSKPYTDEFGSFVSYYKPWVDSSGTPVVIGIDKEVTLVNAIQKVAVISLIIPLFIVIFIASIVSIIVAGSMTKGLKVLDFELRNLAESDADLSVRIQSLSKDEIGKVAESFNKFVLKLQNLVVNINTVVNNTDEIKSEIVESTCESSASIDQISVNLKRTGTQLILLDENINGTADTIGNLSRNIYLMDDQIAEQSTMVENSTSAVTEMMALLDSVNAVAHTKKDSTNQLSQIAEEGKNNIDNTEKAFKQVVQYIEQIQQMTATINNIAAQTNLLSMNAAIEAAHAGDSGKGFAVVAEEIRKLADSAGQSSASISKLIKDITQSVKDTEIRVITSSESFDKITIEVNDTVNAFAEIEKSVFELTTGGKEIQKTTDHINEITSMIKTGSEEVKLGTEQMHNASIRIKDISKTVNTSMTESISASEEIVNSMQLMVDLTQKLDKTIGVLKNDFGQFKINS